MIAIKVPPLGESIVEATISRWLRNEGETVAAGETLVELETDKVTVEVPALKAGVLVRRARQEGDVVSVGDDLGMIDETAISTTPPAAAPSAPTPAVAPPAPTAGLPVAPEHVHPAQARVSPAAQRIADETGITLSGVTGTGRGGVVSKPDVIEFLRGTAGTLAQVPVAPAPETPPSAPLSPVPAVEARQPSPTPPEAAAPVLSPLTPRPSPLDRLETVEKMTTRRRRIAEHLLESQHATAHLTTFNEIDMSAVETLRARVKERIEKEHGFRLSLMPFFVKAACTALRQFPVVNARIDDDQIVYHHYVNMGIAVAADAGLVVPNLKDADRMGMLQVGKAIADVARRARDAKLTMDDLTGGTFTITNGGVFGSLLSTPIINYPQVGILGLHKTQDRPVAVDGQVVIRPMMYVALSYDHRIVDGQQAVLFLVRVKELMEDPALLAID